MSNELVKVQFNNQYIEAIKEGQEVWVAVSKICQNLKIDSWRQSQKIQENPVFDGRYQLMLAPSHGGTQETFCLNLDRLTLWLASIQANRVNEDVREELVKYQIECADVLNTHFFGRKNELLDKNKVLEATTCLPLYMEAAEIFGFKGNDRILSANKAVKNTTGIDLLAKMEANHLISERQEKRLTPTEIGREFGVSAIKINRQLTELGLQEDHRDAKKKLTYRLTPKGMQYGVYMDTGKRHGGTPVQQVKWYESIIHVLEVA